MNENRQPIRAWVLFCDHALDVMTSGKQVKVKLTGRDRIPACPAVAAAYSGGNDAVIVIPESLSAGIQQRLLVTGKADKNTNSKAPGCRRPLSHA